METSLRYAKLKIGRPICGIMTDEWRTVKRVRKSDNPEYIRLEPVNKEYDEQEIPKSIIRGVWQVLGSVKKFF